MKSFQPATTSSMSEQLLKVIKRRRYPLGIMLICVRWYVAYPLSLRHIEEMMAERGVPVDHATIHRWSIKILPVLASVCQTHAGFKSFACARTIISGIETMHMIKKGQLGSHKDTATSAADQF